MTPEKFADLRERINRTDASIDMFRTEDVAEMLDEIERLQKIVSEAHSLQFDPEEPGCETHENGMLIGRWYACGTDGCRWNLTKQPGCEVHGFHDTEDRAACSEDDPDCRGRWVVDDYFTSLTEAQASHDAHVASILRGKA